MTLTEENQRVLILHTGKMADDETARQAEQLLAENAEAREFAKEIRRITTALQPTAEERKPLSDEELEPWLRLAKDRFPDETTPPIRPHYHWFLRRRVWFTAAIAASLLIVIGLWRLWPSAMPAPKPAEPVGRLWQLPRGGALNVATVLTQDVRDGETVTLEQNRPGKIELAGAAVWLQPGSELSLSEKGTVLDLRKGGLALVLTAGKPTWRVRVGPVESTLQSGLLEVRIVADASTWKCYQGGVQLRLKSGRMLPIGEREQVLLGGDGEPIIQAPRQLKDSRPRWLKWAENSFQTFVIDAKKDSPSK